MCSTVPIRLLSLLRSLEGLRRFLILTLIMIPLSLASWTPVRAINRLAFVVGVNTYDNLPDYRQLKNSVNDAVAVAAVFDTLGYQVTSGRDLTRAEFYAAWQTFLEEIRENDIAAIFLSAHGVEIEGQNYILPRDIPNITFGRQEQLKSQSLSVSDLLLDLRDRRPGVTLLILDACRDNPLIPPEYKNVAGSSGGLVRIEAVVGEFIMYSAAAGQTSLDRLPGDQVVEHSVYVRHLLPMMQQANLTLPELARRLRERVKATAEKVAHPQWPAYYDGLIGKFCLQPCGAAAPSAGEGGEQQPEAAGRLSDASRAMIACYLARREDWESCQ